MKKWRMLEKDYESIPQVPRVLLNPGLLMVIDAMAGGHNESLFEIQG